MSPLPESLWRWLGVENRAWLVVQACVPVVLVAVVIGLILLKVDTASELDTRSHQGRIQAAQVACQTVHTSDIALHGFLTKTFDGSADSRTQKFLRDLLASDEATYTQCLDKASRVT